MTITNCSGRSGELSWLGCLFMQRTIVVPPQEGYGDRGFAEIPVSQNYSASSFSFCSSLHGEVFCEYCRLFPSLNILCVLLCSRVPHSSSIWSFLK